MVELKQTGTRLENAGVSWNDVKNASNLTELLVYNKH